MAERTAADAESATGSQANANGSQAEDADSIGGSEYQSQMMAELMRMVIQTQQMMAMKTQLLRELDAQRSAIMEDFEAKKANNSLDIYSYAKEFNIDIDEIQSKKMKYQPNFKKENSREAINLKCLSCLKAQENRLPKQNWKMLRLARRLAMAMAMRKLVMELLAESDLFCGLGPPFYIFNI